MAQAVSIDLRRRLVSAIAKGKSRRAAAAQFEVAPSTAVRLKQRLDRTGSLEPGRRGRPAGCGKLAPCRDLIINKVKEQPDITMPDLATWLLERKGISVDPSNLSKLLCKAGFTYKKNVDGDGTRTR
jgi:transposase